MAKIAILIVLLSFSSLIQANELYRSKAGDSGKYYIIENKALGDNIFQVLSSRIGKNDAYTDFTLLKVNCNTAQYFELAGLSEDGAKNKPSKELKDWSKDSKWVNLITGSSKYDLVNHICNKYR
ncbi:hypothetical protein [Shewanella surugensis]|uniref:DUF2511 domain-containing protein n=1 Tax=Shewanella surugensis TaxID=212020 RepID=A0ABT0L6K4_9GAMM|nr:hypothetical protein [Shewanella surugensis]MCL1123322.1 hypothetical protein [Shewanella surugensis]